MRSLLMETAERATSYLEGLEERRVAPAAEDLQRLSLLDEPLPEKPSDPQSVLRLLDEIGSPATVASAGGRFFGFVMGGSLPAALACNWLAGAWDQDAGMQVASPISATLENVSLKWLLDVLKLPASSGGGFVTGATMANFSGLAAARHAVLQKEGWDANACSEYPSMGRGACARRRFRKSQALPSCACKPGMSTPAPSTRQRRSSLAPTRLAPGCISMARSACGLPLPRSAPTWSPGLPGRIHGQRMPTSG